MTLLNIPPETLIINGTEHPINADYRAVLLYHEALKDEDIDRAFRALFESIPVDYLAAAEQVNWFIACGQTEKKSSPPNSLLGITNAIPMDYAEDADLIWSAFRRVYQIDLRRIEFLHWWDFRGMLAELPSDCRLSRLIEIRTKDTSAKEMSKEERTKIRTLQKYYKIKDKPTQREERLREALRNGEDPTPYL